MTRPFGVRIISVIFVILLLNLAFMPGVSAQTNSGGLHHANGANTIGENFPDPEDTTPRNTTVNDTAKEISVSPQVLQAVAGIYVLDYLATAVVVVVFADGTLAWYNNNDYLVITDVIVKTAINGILDLLGLRSAGSYEDAYRKGLPTQNHERIIYDKDHRNLPITDGKNSSKDLVDSDGKLIQRRYYDANGKAEIDWDYNHDHGKGIPHQHRFRYNSDGSMKDRVNVIFNSDGSETIIE